MMPTHEYTHIDITKILNEDESHYFLSTAFGWATGQSISELKRKLKDNGLTIPRKKITLLICRVDLPSNAKYDIRFYLPQTDKLTWVITDKI